MRTACKYRKMIRKILGTIAEANGRVKERSKTKGKVVFVSGMAGQGQL